MAPERSSWDDVWLDVAAAVARRSSCSRSQVGAVWVFDNFDTFVGYNGPKPGATNCSDGGCPRGLKSFEELPSASSFRTKDGKCFAVHAEVNAILKFQHRHNGMHRSVLKLIVEHSKLYTTREPCEECWDAIRRSGLTIPQVVWRS